jgi:histidinol-phosphatase (PHP family)
MPVELYANYYQTINALKIKYASKIEIYCGLEVDYIDDMNSQILSFINARQLDFTIGSIHFLGKLTNQSYWNIDGTAEMFAEGMTEIFDNNGEALIKHYYYNVCQMVENMNPTIIGHIDKIKLHNEANCYFAENTTYYKKAALEALNLIKEKDNIVEFNTRAYYRHNKPMPYPSLWVLREMKKRNIRVTLNSDSHKPEQLLNCYNEGLTLLREAGYSQIVILKDKRWQEVSII